MNPILISVFIGSFTVTSYRSVPNQTDNSPCITSINESVNAFGVAVHRDLLCPVAKVTQKNGRFKVCQRNLPGCDKSKLHYYDLLWIEDVGFKYINDTMAIKTKMNSRLDVWVEQRADEKAFHKKFKNKKLNIWRITDENVYKEVKNEIQRRSIPVSRILGK